MKFTKYNNPSKRRKRPHKPRTGAYRAHEQALYEMLAKEPRSAHSAILKAYEVSINP